MVPEFSLVVRIVSVVWQHTLHHGNDSLRTLLSLLPAGECHSVFHHLLNLPAVFRQYEFLSLGIVIQSF